MEIQMIEEMRRFNYLSNEIDAVYHDAALKFGLSDSALLILYTICSNGNDCLLSDITHLSGVSKQTINSAVHKLEQEEIVYLEAFRGRKKKICLTQKAWIWQIGLSGISWKLRMRFLVPGQRPNGSFTLTLHRDIFLLSGKK